jgi:ribosomal protein S19E (S16A)
MLAREARAGASKLPLSKEHERELVDDSGISPEFVAARGYYTAARRSEVPETFPEWQRRLGLVVPLYSPDGESVGYQLKPNKPRYKGPKYETPADFSPVVDVHPRMLEEARHGDGPLLITEGAKTGDAATSRGMCTVVLAGVWMWCVPKVKPYRLKPCFDHIRLEGREVLVAFDSDCMSKASVQEALAALVSVLEDRGADVKVIYLPDATDGSKQGVDDYLAAGGTMRELRALARKFDPADVGRIRLSRDEKLQRSVEDLWRRWWEEEWKGRGGHSDRDVAHQLIEAATRWGKIHADGLRVHISWGTLQVRAKVSRRTLTKALSRLEERGFLYRDNEGRKADKTGSFVLRAKVDHYGERVSQETSRLRPCDPGGLPSRVPRLRWTRPKFTPRRGIVTGTRKVRESKPLAPRDRIERLGKIRGAVVDALVASGGSCTLDDLCKVLHRKRARDVKRRILPMLEEAGVIEYAGDVVALAPNWSERLDDARRNCGELEADELAEERRKRKSRAYRERYKAPTSKPSAAGLSAVRRSHERRDTCLRESALAEEKRRRDGPPPALQILLSGMLGQLDRGHLDKIRMDLLCEEAIERGFDLRDVPGVVHAKGHPVERIPEYGDEEFVFPRKVIANSPALSLSEPEPPPDARRQAP